MSRIYYQERISEFSTPMQSTSSELKLLWNLSPVFHAVWRRLKIKSFGIKPALPISQYFRSFTVKNINNFISSNWNISKKNMVIKNTMKKLSCSAHFKTFKQWENHVMESCNPCQQLLLQSAYKVLETIYRKVGRRPHPTELYCGYISAIYWGGLKVRIYQMMLWAML